MKDVDLPYVKVDISRHGLTRYYVRRGERKIRIMAAPGTPAFRVACAAALATFEAEKVPAETAKTPAAPRPPRYPKMITPGDRPDARKMRPANDR